MGLRAFFDPAGGSACRQPSVPTDFARRIESLCRQTLDAPHPTLPAARPVAAAPAVAPPGAPARLERVVRVPAAPVPLVAVVRVPARRPVSDAPRALPTTAAVATAPVGHVARMASPAVVWTAGVTVGVTAAAMRVATVGPAPSVAILAPMPASSAPHAALGPTGPQESARMALARVVHVLVASVAIGPSGRSVAIVRHAARAPMVIALVARALMGVARVVTAVAAQAAEVMVVSRHGGSSVRSPKQSVVPRRSRPPAGPSRSASLPSLPRGSASSGSMKARCATRPQPPPNAPQRLRRFARARIRSCRPTSPRSCNVWRLPVGRSAIRNA